MEITILGYFAIVLTILFILLRKTDYFLYTAIFFSGFLGSSVINVGLSPIRPSLFFFGIFFFLSLFKKDFAFQTDKVLLIFFGYCVISLFFPFLYSSAGIEIMNQRGNYELLHFSSSNIVHIFNLLIDLLFLSALLRLGDKDKKEKAMRAYKYGYYAVIAICFYQLLAFRFSLPFDVLFRQSPHGNVQGSRLYGPCDEASMLCYFLVPSIIVTMQKEVRTRADMVAAPLAIAIGVLTESSTFLVGCVFMAIFALPACVRFLTTKHKPTTWGVVLIALGALCAVMLVVNEKIMRLFGMLIAKLLRENTSGVERSESMLRVLLVGLKIPTGVGFGSARSKDLLSTWMCNVGLVGMAIYIVFLVRYTVRAHRAGELKTAAPYLIVVLLMMIAVPEPYNLFVWFLLYFGYHQATESSQKKQNAIHMKAVKESQ